jgi:hypothetical protein
MAPRRENSQRRRRPTRPPARTILVVCGGTRTEPDYLDGMRREHRRPSLRIVVQGKGLDPKGLVEYARSLARRAPGEFDEVWCVVDLDEFDLTAAEATAASAGVRLAVSNPCFELWLLLHFDDCTSHVDGAGDAARRLRRHLPAYDKSELDFADFSAGVPAAVSRARALDAGETVGPNPSTGVWKLVQGIVEEEQ